MQYWTGSQWSVVPGGNITGNQLVWRRFTFSPLSTTAIRVLVTGGPALTRIAEVEAYESLTPSPPPPPPPNLRLNVAKAANGGRVTASSTFSTNYATSVRERWEPQGHDVGKYVGGCDQRGLSRLAAS